MIFENIELYDSIALDVLKKYGWENSDEAKLVVMSENATYMIRNKKTKENDGVLRISRPGYHTIDELNSEMSWLKQINECTPLRVANPIKGLDGQMVQEVIGIDGKSYLCSVYEFLEGKAPDENNVEQMIEQFRKLGEATAYLHHQTEVWSGANQLHRGVWTYDTIIGTKAVWGDWRNFSQITEEEKGILNRVANIIKKRLDEYGKNKNNFGLIHADLRLANLLIEQEQIKVIDFDDCGFGWHLHDLASALSFIEEKPYVPQLINSWLEGYKKIHVFTNTDFEEINTFIMMRRIQLTAWLSSHQESESAKELSINWMEGTMILAKRYLNLFN